MANECGEEYLMIHAVYRDPEGLTNHGSLPDNDRQRPNRYQNSVHPENVVYDCRKRRIRRRSWRKCHTHHRPMTLLTSSPHLRLTLDLVVSVAAFVLRH